MTKPFVVPLALTSPTEKEEQDTAGLEQVREFISSYCNQCIYKDMLTLVMRADRDVACLVQRPAV